MMNLRTYIFSVLLLPALLLLTGCGGSDSGGGGSASATPGSSAASPGTASEAPLGTETEAGTEPEAPSDISDSPSETLPPSDAQQVEDLNISDEFDYQSTREITLNINMPSLAGSRSYVSVYSRYTQIPEEPVIRPDPDSRLINTALKNGSATLNITTLSASTHLLTEVWVIGNTTAIQRLTELMPVGSDQQHQYTLTD